MCQKVFVSEYRKTSQGNPSVFFTKFLVSKKVMDKKWGMKEGGVSRYSVKNVLSQSTERLRREPFYFIQIFWDRNTLWIGGGE